MGAGTIRRKLQEFGWLQQDIVSDGELSLRLGFHIQNNEIQGWIDGKCVITAVDPENKLTGVGGFSD